MHYGEGKCYPFFSRWCWRCATHFAAVGAAFYTTAMVNAACFFRRWCRRDAAHFSAVGAAFCTTARVNAVRFFTAVGVGVRLPNLLLLVPSFTLRLGKMLPVFQPLVLPLCCPFYCCWCTTARVNDARFSAVGVGVMLPNFPLIVPSFTLRLG